MGHNEYPAFISCSQDACSLYLPLSCLCHSFKYPQILKSLHTEDRHSDLTSIPTDTVQSQYARGPLSIASWAHITNAHLLPGPTIVPSLRSAAHSTMRSLSNSVSTDIYADSPRTSLDSESSPEPPERIDCDLDNEFYQGLSGRKPSIVTATTTISQTFESAVPALARTVSRGEGQAGDREEALDALGAPPLARGLLLLAEMSSEGNLITSSYTQACVEVAREYPDFVLGFVSQQNLNEEEGDNFLSFTPGVNLPPIGETEVRGDGKGQQYRTPRTVIVDEGADIIIVGRGILGAKNRGREVERYRRAAWEAYEQRIGRKERKMAGK